MTKRSSIIPYFRNLTPSDRLKVICALEPEFVDFFQAFSGETALSLNQADGMIENVIGRFQLPLGIATNFIINGKEYLVPMAVEEPSVVAAASHMAKLTREIGGFHAKADRPVMRGQIQVMGISDLESAKATILKHKAELQNVANEKDRTLFALGGGCEDIEVYCFEETAAGAMLIVHLLVDVRDAMGANTVNTMAEHIAPMVDKLTGGKTRLRIMSNLADKRLVSATVTLNARQFSTLEFDGKDVVQGIVEASALAEVDPYRAATHNKGIMNAIDPIVVVTGNDWRAVEAGAHAYAAQGGHYTGLSRWCSGPDDTLTGKIELPMAVGLVGGATKTHPTAQASLALLGVETSAELAEIIAAVGLAQNLAALRALASEGIQRGHMSLHARNIALQAGATGEEVNAIIQDMIRAGEITTDHASNLLNQYRTA